MLDISQYSRGITFNGLTSHPVVVPLCFACPNEATNSSLINLFEMKRPHTDELALRESKPEDWSCCQIYCLNPT